MNWQKIEKEYPLSWKEFLNSLHGCELPLVEANNFTRITNDLFERILYDFFDWREIHVCVWRVYDTLKSWWESNMFQHWSGVYKEFGSRKEAETAAFLEAFNILENKLRGEK